MTNTEIDALVAERDEAREAKDYARADAIRARLSDIREGTAIPYRVALLDQPSGTFWYWTAS